MLLEGDIRLCAPYPHREGWWTVLAPGGTMVLGPEHLAKHPLDLTDRATFLLALDDLAKRVGLNPAGGVLWFMSDQTGFWVLQEDPEQCSGGWREFEDIDTDDPLAALRAALETTEPAG